MLELCASESAAFSARRTTDKAKPRRGVLHAWSSKKSCHSARRGWKALWEEHASCGRAMAIGKGAAARAAGGVRRKPGVVELDPHIFWRHVAAPPQRQLAGRLGGRRTQRRAAGSGHCTALRCTAAGSGSRAGLGGRRRLPPMGFVWFEPTRTSQGLRTAGSSCSIEAASGGSAVHTRFCHGRLVRPRLLYSGGPP